MIPTNKPEKPAGFYDDNYDREEYRKPWQQSRYLATWEQALKFLPEDKSIKILDAGCGPGQLLAMIRDKGYHNITGIDFSEKAIKMACELRPDLAHLYLVDDLFMHDYSVYDLVICTEVLEHVQQDLQLVKLWRQLCRQVIITVPSYDSEAHVRFFPSAQSVTDRYGPYFINHRCEAVKTAPGRYLFVFEGRTE